jgi:hypothetical protein
MELGAPGRPATGPEHQQPVTGQSLIGPDRPDDLVVDHLLDREPGQRPTLGTLGGVAGGPTASWERWQMARGVAPLPGGAAAQQHLPAGEPFGRCQARSFRLLPPPDRYSGSSAARSRTSAARSRASARWLRSSAARSRSSAMWSRWSAARSRAARTSWVRSGLRCVGPARSGPPATPVRPPSPRLGCPDPGVVQRLGRDPLPLDVLDELLGDLGQLAR